MMTCNNSIKHKRLFLWINGPQHATIVKKSCLMSYSHWILKLSKLLNHYLISLIEVEKVYRLQGRTLSTSLVRASWSSPFLHFVITTTTLSILGPNRRDFNHLTYKTLSFLRSILENWMELNDKIQVSFLYLVSKDKFRNTNLHVAPPPR